MKIGIEAQRIFRKKIHGMEVVIIEIIKELQRLDTSNEYIVYVRQNTIQRVFATPNFKIKVIDASSFVGWEQWVLPRQAKKDEVDILHCTSNTAPLYYKGKKMLTLHDIIYLEKINIGGTYYQKFGNLYRRFIVPNIIKSMCLILTVSQYEKNRIARQFGLPENLVKVVHNGLSEIFRVQEDKDRFESLPGEFMLHLGNTAEKKNTKRVIKAYCAYCESVSDPMALVVTDLTKGQLDNWLTKRVQKILKGKIIVLPYIENTEMPTLYKKATVFLYPSLRESFGMPILEAMSCGTPVITSNTSSMPEIAGGAAILVDPFSVEIIQNLMIKLTENESLLDELRTKGLIRAANFSWKNAALQYLNCYQSIV